MSLLKKIICEFWNDFYFVQNFKKQNIDSKATCKSNGCLGKIERPKLNIIQIAKITS